jgi:hypothetical protein
LTQSIPAFPLRIAKQVAGKPKPGLAPLLAGRASSRERLNWGGFQISFLANILAVRNVERINGPLLMI